MKNYTLGLDIGANSVGWALVTDESSSGGEKLLTGVRVFPEGTEPTKAGEQSRNLPRRQARLARRQHERRSRRKLKLRKILSRAGVLPTEREELGKLLQSDPYELRRRALDDALRAEEFARALLHLNQRRGFKSNLKAEGDRAKEEKGIKLEISTLKQQIKDAGARTLGEYFACLKARGEKIRGRHTSRSMYDEGEFERIWSSQAGFHPEIWTDELKREVHRAIFHQRPLKPQDHLIGKCSLEPGERRCPAGSWYAQQFRVLKEVNDLRILSRQAGEQYLSAEQRDRLIEELMRRKSPLKVDVMKNKLLKLNEGKSLNYERKERDKLEGNRVEAYLRAIFGKEFDEKSDWLRATVWQTLVSEDPDEFRRKALEEWALRQEQVEALCRIPRASGYFSYSLKAIQKILPYLEEGCNEYDAIRNARYPDKEAEVLQYLPPVHASDFRNPVVVRALSEARKVVNGIVREHGLPSRIMVELARETKGTIKTRQKRHQEMLRRETHHQGIRLELEKLGVPANRDTIEKYKLWEECGKMCPYTGQSIGPHQLFGPTSEFDVEHIFPYSQSLDNTFFNKTLCARSENLRKRDKTPYEAYHGTPQYDDILHRVLRNPRMPYDKKKRFSLKGIPDDWGERQLRDSSYIAKAVCRYLRHLGLPVDTTRGQITAELRRQWGLNSILGGEGARVKVRDDHRHHAVDAVVIALTTTSHINSLKHVYDFRKGKEFPSPWEDAGVNREAFRRHVRASVEAINVSHRPQRKVSGQFNLETNYGKTAKKGVYVYRVDLRNLSAPKAKRIVDSVVREIVCARLREHGIEPGKGPGNVPAAVFAEPLYMKSPKGDACHPIKRVRISEPFEQAIPIKDADGNTYRFVKPGSNHHMTIFEYTDDQGNARRCKEVVTRFEAYQRVMRGEPVIRRTHTQHPEAKFWMSLMINDMLLYQEQDGRQNLYRVQKLSERQGEEGVDLHLRLHTAAKIDSKETLRRVLTLSAKSFKARKVSVDVLGRIHPCSD